MKLTTRWLAALLLLLPLSAPMLAADLVNVEGAEKRALGGYDPVAFFTDAMAVKGSPLITARHRGATYMFATEEHRKLFEQDPDKFAPQYGGFCAYGVAVGALVPVDITTWQVRDGKLFLNKDHRVLAMFNTDFEGNVMKANKNWPGLVVKDGK
ncbi:MAG TPA: YHS domain-containing (seleno)protein [Candidatus Polarisedimenticolia bacterium]|nr:YHS domain-containing (seleno)protein [Candidatus Polarisedimenticolia bacterium]